MGNIDNESLNDTSVKTKGTSLNPPTYDCRTIFSVFGNGGTNKRVVDMDQIWTDAQNASAKSQDEQGGETGGGNKKKYHKYKSHSRHIRPSTNTKMILQHQIDKHKESMAAIKRANSHPSLQTAHDMQLASKPTKSLRKSLNNFSTPISYHGFLASEMRRASWERETTISPPSGDQSIAVLKEIYQIR
ncbi:hypothetical protein ACHWQZ_G005153 [Mnemiopsis leidyi]